MCSQALHLVLDVQVVVTVQTATQGQIELIEHRSEIENLRNLWVTSPGEYSVLSQYNYIRELDVPPSYAIFIPRPVL